MQQYKIDKTRSVDVIFDEACIAERIDALAAKIRISDQNDILVVAILKGSFIFAADLLRAMHRKGLAPEVDFITLQSYHEGTKSSGVVKIVRDIERDVRDRDVLIIDDILESGRTLRFAANLVMERGARSVKTCVLLNKHVERASDIEADYVAFDCPNVFVIGYGMDMANRYRELPFVGQLVER